MIFSDHTIEKRMALPRFDPKCLRIDPYDESHLQGASYDVHLQDTITRKGGIITLSEDMPYVLPPHGTCLAALQEYVVTPTDAVCRLEGVSTNGRMFIIVHCTAGWGDPGYCGNFTVEIVNHDPDNFFAMTKGMRIGQLTWLQLDCPAKRLYKGRYQGDTIAQGAKAEAKAKASTP